MAVIGKATQQPADRIDYDIDLTSMTDDGDTVMSATTNVTPNDLPVSAVLNTPHTMLKLWVGPGGVSGVTYKIEVTVTTLDGRVKQDEVKIKVKEV
jgi:hypothetical protein